MKKLLLPKAQIARFKKKALKTSDEVEAILVGTIEGDTIVVSQLYYPPAAASADSILISPVHIYRLAEFVARDGKMVLGSLHSHPGVIPHVTKADMECARDWGEVVWGVFSYWKDESSKRRRTSLDFYLGHKMGELDVRMDGISVRGSARKDARMPLVFPTIDENP